MLSHGPANSVSLFPVQGSLKLTLMICSMATGSRGRGGLTLSIPLALGLRSKCSPLNNGL